MLIQGDARAIPLADRSVQCVVTSPPYWGLRDYGTATWVGGDADCDHVSGMARGDTNRDTPGGRGGSFRGGTVQFRDVCGKCGAARVDAQLGLEATPDAYVAGLVAVFRQVWRVLRDDGVCFLNLGDWYAGGGGFSPNAPSNLAGSKQTTQRGARSGGLPVGNGLKPKDLVGIPWRVAFALQADGWYLRSDIIWAKPNPMPESVTDRPTKSHEYVFLLTKAERYAWYPDAVREPHQTALNVPTWQARRDAGAWKGNIGVAENYQRNVHAKGLSHDLGHPDGRNIRSVWTIATQPYAGAHFATMPEALARRCVLAATQTGDRVLDPFAGSGTVPRCAISLGRRGIGMDLSPAYLDLATERITVTRGLPFDAITA